MQSSVMLEDLTYSLSNVLHFPGLVTDAWWHCGILAVFAFGHARLMEGTIVPPEFPHKPLGLVRHGYSFWASYRSRKSLLSYLYTAPHHPTATWPPWLYTVEFITQFPIIPLFSGPLKAHWSIKGFSHAHWCILNRLEWFFTFSTHFSPPY